MSSTATIGLVLIGLVVMAVVLGIISLFEEELLALVGLGMLGFVAFLIGKLVIIMITGKT